MSGHCSIQGLYSSGEMERFWILLLKVLSGSERKREPRT